MQFWIIVPNRTRKLRKAREQGPNAHVHMHKKSDTPVVDVNVALLDPEKADVGVVGNVGRRNAGHENGKKRERQQKRDCESGLSVENIPEL